MHILILHSSEKHFDNNLLCDTFYNFSIECIIKYNILAVNNGVSDKNEIKVCCKYILYNTMRV